MQRKYPPLKFALALGIAIFLFFFSARAAVSYEASSEETARLAALPWLDELPLRGLTRFDNEAKPAAIRRYSLLKNKLDGSPWRKLRPLRVDKLDLNGDEYPDLAIVTPKSEKEPSYTYITFYAGCGNGWYYEVLQVPGQAAAGKGYSLLTPVQHGGVSWKAIDAPGRLPGQAVESGAKYQFMSGSYVRTEPQRLKAIPWVRDGASLVHLPGDTFTKPVARYRMVIDSASKAPARLLRRSGDFGAPLEGLAVETETIDLNEDAFPDLAVIHMKDGRPVLHSFLAGCGQGWYMLVFQTTAPRYGISEAQAQPGRPGKWKTLLIPPAGKAPKERFTVHKLPARTVAVPPITEAQADKFEEFHFSRTGYIPAAADQKFVNALGKTPWVRSKNELHHITPYGVEVYSFWPERDPEEDTPGQNYHLAWKDFILWQEGDFPLESVKLNDSRAPGYVHKQRSGAESGQGHVYTFYAGCGRDFFVAVLEETFTDASVKTDERAGKKAFNLFWHDVVAKNQRLRFEDGKYSPLLQ